MLMQQAPGGKAFRKDHEAHLIRRESAGTYLEIARWSRNGMSTSR